VVEARVELTRQTAGDVQDRVVEGGTEQAQGIEALLRIGVPTDRRDAREVETTIERGFNRMAPNPTTTGTWS
jgi:hypothetical protein